MHTFKFCTVTLFPPIRPAIFLPLKTLLGHCFKNLDRLALLSTVRISADLQNLPCADPSNQLNGGSRKHREMLVNLQIPIVS